MSFNKNLTLDILMTIDNIIYVDIKTVQDHLFAF